MRLLIPTAVVLVGASCSAGSPAPPPEVRGTTQAASYLSPYAGWSVASGQETAALGLAVAGRGDVNGDGNPDALLGVPGFDDGQASEGAVFLFLGDGTAYSAVPDWQLFGEEVYAFLGGSVEIVGDLNGDGFDDVAVGAWRKDGIDPDAGNVSVFFGSETGLAEEADWTRFGAQGDSAYGLSLAGGDLNNDGFDDLIVGAPEWDGPTGPNEGAVFIYNGSEEGLPAFGVSETLFGDMEGVGFGYAVASGGDAHGDEFEDLLVGAPDWSATQPLEGKVLLFDGAEEGVATTESWSAVGGSPFARLGHSVDIAGDTNGDGFADLLAGMPYFDDLGFEQGQAQLWFGSDEEIEVAAPDWSFVGFEGGGLFGWSVVGPGDLDGDGIDDVVAGASHADIDVPNEGLLFAFPGVLDAGPLAYPGRIQSGGVAVSFFGTAIAPAGDVNGDGFADILVGAWANSIAAAGEGSAVLLYGIPATVDVDQDGYCAGLDECAGGVPGGDCDDLNPGAYPGATETCDGVDEDCDGALPLDEQDNDGDGWMDCEGDCNDGDATVFPTAEEVCDDEDHDCDGLIDNGVVPPRYWIDGDGDGHGNPLATPVQSCTGPPTADYVAVPDDCDDDDPNIHPGAAETICNGEDEDCSFLTPDVPDRDGDAFTPCEDCQLLGTTLQCGDCDDTDQEINPYMAETCGDEIDQDCDGEDPECAPPPECNEPDNICEDIGCSCSTATGDQVRGSVLLLLLLAPMLGRTRRSRR